MHRENEVMQSCRAGVEGDVKRTAAKRLARRRSSCRQCHAFMIGRMFTLASALEPITPRQKFVSLTHQAQKGIEGELY